MAEMLSPEELDEIREVVRNVTGPKLDEADAPEGAAELELLALNAMGPFGDPYAPAELVSLLPAALEERGDELAAGLLGAYATLAPFPLAALSAKARDRLAADGIVSPFAEAIGALHPRECYRLELSGAEAVGALVRRDGDSLTQSAMVIIERGPSGEVIVDGLLNGPEDPDAAGRELDELIVGDSRTETRSSAATERRLRAALRGMVEGELALESEAVPALALLERALTGSNGRWPRPLFAIPDSVGIDSGEEEEERLRYEAETLVEEFASVLEEQAPLETALREHGPDTAFLMLDWKIGYADRELTRWTHDDLREFLLDWYPRKGDSDEETLAAVPNAVTAFIRFLGARDLLLGTDAEALAATVERLRDRFEAAARDRGNWGLAKSMVAQMRSEGVDPTDQGAIDAWMEDFNSRPREERDRVLEPPASSRLRSRRRTRRRAARAARKRNRR
jgi:hypothetical protein